MKEELFCAAIITSAHGLQGHVKVKCFLENPRDLKAYSPFCNPEGEPVYKITKVLSQTQEMATISLEGIKDRTQAEALKGTELMVPRERLKPLTEDTFYHQDLIGLSVHSPQGTRIGHVYALHNFGAGDILEVQTLEDKLIMLPFTHAMVPIVHVADGFVQLSAQGEEMLHDH